MKSGGENRLISIRGYIHEKEKINGIGFPVELSAGLLKTAGIGLKAKGLVGRDSHIGIVMEFLVGS